MKVLAQAKSFITALYQRRKYGLSIMEKMINCKMNSDERLLGDLNKVKKGIETPFPKNPLVEVEY